MQAYFNPTKRNLKKWVQFTLNRANKCYMRFSQPRSLKVNLQAYFKSTKTLEGNRIATRLRLIPAKSCYDYLVNYFVLSKSDNFD